ncbi:MAG: FGGY-family carbohydrate kinase [Defluviitaleaceae bacterium]|nr:FGGY-family carbohydrate kinase [Defluviitaleaceae bacterium]
MATKNSLGIELGSTRIKAVLLDDKKNVLEIASYDWENQFVGGFWTYDLAEVWAGVKSVVAKITQKFAPQTIGYMGFSAMMHGYLAFDENGELLVPFRTWRNSNTQAASDILTKEFNFNIPKRYSIAHLYQAFLNGEEHIGKVSYITTLAGYVHWQLTGQKVLGIGDASGVFPTNQQTKEYDTAMLAKFNQLSQKIDKINNFDISKILPKILLAGENAGTLTEKGANLLGLPLGTNNETVNITFCPPEGDAGTGMVATNAIAPQTGNVSAGTSVFAMIVLEKPLTNVYPEIDIVTTPTGEYVAMIHADNCTSDINAWVNVFGEFAAAIGDEKTANDQNKLFETLFTLADQGDLDCGGLVSYGFVSGESIADVKNGVPLFLRLPGSKFKLANFIRAHIYGAFAALYLGMKVLQKEEIRISTLAAHGGIFKSSYLPQRTLSAAMQGVPITVTPTAGEGGAYGMALLAAFVHEKSHKTLEDFLDNVFEEMRKTLNIGKIGKIAEKAIVAEEEENAAYQTFMENYTKMLEIERKADILCQESQKN